MTESLAERQAGSTEFAGVDLVATAGTLYKKPEDPSEADVRFNLSLETAENFNEAGIPYVVVDNSPTENRADEWVAGALRERGAIVLRASGGKLASQRLQGVAFAVQNGAEKVLGQEPEKVGMPAFAGQVSKALDKVDVLVVGRTQRAEDSLPPVQQRTERLAGWIIENSFDFPKDALCGPRGFTVAGAEVLSHYPVHDPDMDNWIYLYYTPLEARAAGLAIGGISVDLIYPEAMVAQETGNVGFDTKRLDQFKLQLDYLLGRDDVRPEASGLRDYTRYMLAPMPKAAGPEHVAEYEERLWMIEEYARGYFPDNDFRRTTRS